MSAEFTDSIEQYLSRIDAYLDRVLPTTDEHPERLHSAMRYAVFNGGKRLRPMLVFATGECLRLPVAKLEPLAAAVELIHAFSLVHDDLPAMDDDDLRRGKPTVHKAYDEATAILAADALQPLAFHVIADSDVLQDHEKAALVRVVAAACGSRGMTGGQAIDLSSEGLDIGADQLRIMHDLKTGALLKACVIGCCELAGDLTEAQDEALKDFADNIGLAFQIRDDILDVEGETNVIGKPAGSDADRQKATWPSVFGLEESRQRCEQLLDDSLSALARFGEKAGLLRNLSRFVVERHM